MQNEEGKKAEKEKEKRKRKNNKVKRKREAGDPNKTVSICQ